MNTLPTEIKEIILRKCDQHTATALSLTCKQLHAIYKENIIYNLIKFKHNVNYEDLNIIRLVEPYIVNIGLNKSNIVEFDLKNIPNVAIYNFNQIKILNTESVKTAICHKFPVNNYINIFPNVVALSIYGEQVDINSNILIKNLQHLLHLELYDYYKVAIRQCSNIKSVICDRVDTLIVYSNFTNVYSKDSNTDVKIFKDDNPISSKMLLHNCRYIYAACVYLDYMTIVYDRNYNRSTTIIDVRIDKLYIINNTGRKLNVQIKLGSKIEHLVCVSDGKKYTYNNIKLCCKLTYRYDNILLIASPSVDISMHDWNKFL